jgi:hypothetical protein
MRPATEARRAPAAAFAADTVSTAGLNSGSTILMPAADSWRTLAARRAAPSRRSWPLVATPLMSSWRGTSSQ